jgi:hypothetical protein
MPACCARLTSPNDADVQIAQVYVHHRPLANAAELRGVASGSPG